MKSRQIEFQTVYCGIQNNEWDNYTVIQWKNWFAAWIDYIENGLPPGGQHPPNRPI